MDTWKMREGAARGARILAKYDSICLKRLQKDEKQRRAWAARKKLIPLTLHSDAVLTHRAKLVGKSQARLQSMLDRYKQNKLNKEELKVEWMYERHFIFQELLDEEVAILEPLLVEAEEKTGEYRCL